MNKTNEENFVQDRLDEIIVSRLGERQRKLNRMDELEMQIKTLRMKPLRTICAIAACISAFVMVLPFSQTEPSLEKYGTTTLDTEYRAALPEIDRLNRLITLQKYDEAIALAENLLVQSKEMLNTFNEATVYWDEEELDYEEQMEHQINSEIRWTYIILLIKTDQLKMAEKQLKQYMKHKEWCENWEEAVELKEALKEKNKNILEKWVTFYVSLL